MNTVTKWAKAAFLSSMSGLTAGPLTVVCRDRTYTFGDAGELDATLTVHDDRFFLRALTGGDIGMGESFMDGDWTTPDLVPLVRLMLQSRRVFEGQGRLTGALHRLAGGARPPPSRQLPRRAAGGTFIAITTWATSSSRLFLDRELRMYSCGYFESAADSLEQAQARKGGSHLPRAETLATRPRPGDRQRLGRVRGLGIDALWLPRHDHDDQRRAVPPRPRLARRGWARPGPASTCCAPTTAS